MNHGSHSKICADLVELSPQYEWMKLFFFRRHLGITLKLVLKRAVQDWSDGRHRFSCAFGKELPIAVCCFTARCHCIQSSRIIAACWTMYAVCSVVIIICNWGKKAKLSVWSAVGHDVPSVVLKVQPVSDVRGCRKPRTPPFLILSTDLPGILHWNISMVRVGPSAVWHPPTPAHVSAGPHSRRGSCSTCTSETASLTLSETSRWLWIKVSPRMFNFALLHQESWLIRYIYSWLNVSCLTHFTFCNSKICQMSEKVTLVKSISSPVLQ